MAFQCVCGWDYQRSENEDGENESESSEEEREWRLPGPSCVDDLVSCVELKEGLRVQKKDAEGECR